LCFQGERPFVCNICGKTYKDYSYYKTHERIHRGERLYKCKYCNKEYYDASYYKKHTRLHTGKQGNMWGKKKRIIYN
jgi:KRAB domain-containing zinc finger protein